MATASLCIVAIPEGRFNEIRPQVWFPHFGKCNPEPVFSSVTASVFGSPVLPPLQ